MGEGANRSTNTLFNEILVNCNVFIEKKKGQKVMVLLKKYVELNILLHIYVWFGNGRNVKMDKME